MTCVIGDLEDCDDLNGGWKQSMSKKIEMLACLESMLDNRIKHLRAFELLLSAAEVPLLLFSVKGGQGP